jgi:hypothetical protein
MNQITEDAEKAVGSSCVPDIPFYIHTLFQIPFTVNCVLKENRSSPLTTDHQFQMNVVELHALVSDFLISVNLCFGERETKPQKRKLGEGQFHHHGQTDK